MEPEKVRALAILGQNIGRLTRQQARTIRGQILAGEIQGALRGLKGMGANIENSGEQGEKHGGEQEK